MYKKHSLNNTLGSISIFLVVVLISMALNEIIFYSLFNPPKYNDDSINCLYISIHFKTPYPILKNIKTVAPYPIFILATIFIFSSFVIILDHIGSGIYMIYKSKIDKKSIKEIYKLQRAISIN